MRAFIEAAFDTSTPSRRGRILEWQDRSTDDYFIFTSSLGTISLRKRTSYPKTYAAVDGSSLYLGYGKTENSHKQRTSSSYTEEFLRMHIDCAQASVHIERDVFCTLPLFIGMEPNRLYFSNRFEFVAAELSPGHMSINRIRLGNYISDQDIQRQDSFIENITTLGERERFQWLVGRHKRTHLTTPLHTSIKGDARRFREFMDALLAEYAHMYTDDRPVGAEFSAGLDSSIIAGFLATHGYDPLLVTLGFPGNHQASQQRKIADFQSRFHTKHATTELRTEHLSPLSRMALSNSWQPFYEREEIYREAFAICAKQLAEHGVDTVFNGIGGDDALARYDSPFTGQTPAPFFSPAFTQTIRATHDIYAADNATPTIPLVSRQVQMARLSHNNVYLDYGIWPVSPLADPRLLMYAQSLSLRYRDNKNIYRMYCQAWQYPESIYRWDVNEDFGAFFEACARHHFGDMGQKWLEHSVLARAGIIDKEQAKTFLRSITNIDDAYQAYKLLTIESNMQLLHLTL